MRGQIRMHVSRHKTWFQIGWLLLVIQGAWADEQQLAQLKALQQLTQGTAEVEALPAPSASKPAPLPGPEPILGETDSARQQAYDLMLQETAPLTPEQIKHLRGVYEQTLEASSNGARTPPRPTTTAQFVRLDPGTTPPVIRMAQGFVSSLVFVDSTGAPWPVDTFSNGNPEAFVVQWNRGDHRLLVQAKALYEHGNLTVTLKKLDTPVVLTLVPGQQAVDYRVDLRVEGFGPNAKALPFGDGLPVTENPLLLNVLNGVPPNQSEHLTVSGLEDMQVWRLGQMMYVRSRHRIVSPAALAMVTSGDGMHVYEMQYAAVVLVSHKGKIIQVKIEG